VNAITSDLMRAHALDPAMDAIAHNADQARLIHNPTPEVDSLCELVSQAMANALAMARMLADLAASNGLEVDCERIVSGFADDVTATLRHCERNTSDAPTSGRRLAVALKPMLDVLCDPARTGEYAEATKRLRRLFPQVPQSALFAPTTTKHLNPRRAAALKAAHDRWQRDRAAHFRRQEARA
jgi:hypothetical protein